LKNQLINNPKPYAILDLGSNSFHCWIAEVHQNTLKPIAHQRQAIRLRDAIDENGQLDTIKKSQVISCLTSFSGMLSHYELAAVRVVGTQPFRMLDAKLGFLQEAESALGYPIEVLSGEQEAQLIYKGVTQGESEKEAVLVLDIGGGSSECVYGLGAQASPLISMPIGGVELMSRTKEMLCLPDYLDRLIQIATEQMRGSLEVFKSLPWKKVWLASGMAEVLGELSQRLGFAEFNRPCFEAIKQAWLVQRGQNWRSQILTEDRLMILPATMAILESFRVLLGFECLHLSRFALREGVLFDLIQHPSVSDLRPETRLNTLIV
jgi:exopolyphosphatase / guanosine-5'-triphosphate,3'-diphosphate pyrophosphatase